VPGTHGAEVAAKDHAPRGTWLEAPGQETIPQGSLGHFWHAHLTHAPWMATILAMPRRRAFDVVFDVRTLDHMDAIESKYHSLIRRTVEEQLISEPDTRTRNRKPLLRETAIGAAWEVRCGPGNRFRIFYDVHRDQRLVVVLAIARKVRNQLFVGKEKFEP
jgi:hypothetical protein